MRLSVMIILTMMIVMMARVIGDIKHGGGPCLSAAASLGPDAALAQWLGCQQETQSQHTPLLSLSPPQRVPRPSRQPRNCQHDRHAGAHLHD